MNPALKIAAGATAMILSFLFFSYGAVTPCGIFKKEMRAAILRETMKKRATTTDDWGKAGLGLGMALSGPMVDSMVDGLTSLQCTRGLIRIATGEPLLTSTSSPDPEPSTPTDYRTFPLPPPLPPASEAQLDAEYEAARRQDTIKAYQDFLYRHKAHEKHYADALARLDQLLHPGGRLKKGKSP